MCIYDIYELLSNIYSNKETTSTIIFIEHIHSRYQACCCEAPQKLLMCAEKSMFKGTHVLYIYITESCAYHKLGRQTEGRTIQNHTATAQWSLISAHMLGCMRQKVRKTLGLMENPSQ